MVQRRETLAAGEITITANASVSFLVNKKKITPHQPGRRAKLVFVKAMYSGRSSIDTNYF
jgi:hypothetical protein